MRGPVTGNRFTRGNNQGFCIYLVPAFLSIGFINTPGRLLNKLDYNKKKLSIYEVNDSFDKCIRIVSTLQRKANIYIVEQ